MKIIEQALTGKKNEEETEDGIAVSDAFAAVIDGSTSKTPHRINPQMRNGRYAMQIICSMIESMDSSESLTGFCSAITTRIAKEYNDITPPPAERLTASAVIYSSLRKEVWLVGDCQCLVDGKLYENPKPYEEHIAAERAKLIRSGLNPDEARHAIVPLLVNEMEKGQNREYAVIDGTPIYMPGVKTIDVSDSSEIILASDGYPFLKSTLKDSEEALAAHIAHDPQNISEYIATKGIIEGNLSFDDRAYLRIKV